MTNKKIEQMKNRIREIDSILDDEAIDDDEFQNLENEARVLQAEIGQIEQKIIFNNVKEIKPNDWIINFLHSFGAVSIDRVISSRQYEIFRKINNGEPFKYNGLRYDPFHGKYFCKIIISKLNAE